jgi:hypothetical protein
VVGLSTNRSQLRRQTRVVHVSIRPCKPRLSPESACLKWGEGTFPPRQGQARDSGILYNIQGPDKVWPSSVEFQINKGCTGDFWMTDGAALTGIGPDGKPGTRVTGPDGKALKIDRFNKGDFKNVTGFRDPTNELEKPHVNGTSSNSSTVMATSGNTSMAGWPMKVPTPFPPADGFSSSPKALKSSSATSSCTR